MNNRKGFSLVELLIVIVIMGILGAGVMLSSSGA
ncbi:MAG: type II secretion system protein, partial [Synergistaceae bacterium]|nr:type II secretion system protein [Synergistaceae bacterium]